MRSRQSGISRTNQQRWGIDTVLGADESTIDLHLFLPENGKPFFTEEELNRKPASVTIWDDQTGAFLEELKDGSGRVVPIRAETIDPAGNPIQERP